MPVSVRDVSRRLSHASLPTPRFACPCPHAPPAPQQRTADDIASLSSYAAVKSASWILGFNEPDNPNADGSNLSPAQAASLWKQYIQPLRTSTRKLVAPAVTSSSNAGQGYSWLKEFIAACSGCTFDAYAFHPYAQDAAAVQGSIDYMLGQGIKPLWVTEFNVDGSHLANGGSGFVTSMVKYFNGKSTSDVARYSMIARVNKDTSVAGQDLQNADGSLNAEGTTYKNA